LRITELELQEKVRIVAENDDFEVLVPFWDFWPFETLIIRHRALERLTDKVPFLNRIIDFVTYVAASDGL